MRTKSEPGKHQRIPKITKCACCGVIDCLRVAGELPTANPAPAAEPQWRPSDGFDATANVGAMS